MAFRHRSRASFRRLHADLLRPGLTVDPTFADAILDRLGHNAHRLVLDGPSMRDPKTAKSDTTAPGPTAADTTATKPATGAEK